MIEYLSMLVRRGRLDSASITISSSGVTYTFRKRGYELEHTYKGDTLANLYDKDYAVKSDLEQLAIDLCRLAEGGNNGNTTKKGTRH